MKRKKKRVDPIEARRRLKRRLKILDEPVAVRRRHRFMLGHERVDVVLEPRRERTVISMGKLRRVKMPALAFVYAPAVREARVIAVGKDGVARYPRVPHAYPNGRVCFGSSTRGRKMDAEVLAEVFHMSGYNHSHVPVNVRTGTLIRDNGSFEPVQVSELVADIAFSGRPALPKITRGRARRLAFMPTADLIAELLRPRRR